MTETIVKIQPAMMPTGVLPYPYLIMSDGAVAGQDFWKGKPARLWGFQSRADVQQIDLACDDWLAGDLTAAINMYAVFLSFEGEAEEGHFWTNLSAIQSVEAVDGHE